MHVKFGIINKLLFILICDCMILSALSRSIIARGAPALAQSVRRCSSRPGSLRTTTACATWRRKDSIVVSAVQLSRGRRTCVDMSACMPPKHTDVHSATKASWMPPACAPTSAVSTLGLTRIQRSRLCVASAESALSSTSATRHT